MERLEAKTSRTYLNLAAITLGTAAICLCVIWSLSASAGMHPEQAQAEPAHNDSEHTHAWQQDVELVHHDALTHQVHHDAQTETIMVPHTICNSCDAIIDRATAEHAAATSHLSYTPDVPRPEQRITQEAWTETVVDQDAYEEVVVTTETCSTCGTRRNLAAHA